MKSKSVKSSICFIPPIENWALIQEIRKKHDKSYLRWMPHINIVYPFVESTEFATSVATISKALANLKPFNVTFSRYDSFNHGKSITAFVEPDSKELVEVNGAIERAFPGFDDLSKRGENGFHPHLSIGQWGKNANLSKVLPQWKPFTTLVDRVYVISRTDDSPFEVKYEVFLGTEVISPFTDQIHPYNNALHVGQQKVRDQSSNISSSSSSSSSMISSSVDKTKNVKVKKGSWFRFGNSFKFLKGEWVRCEDSQLNTQFPEKFRILSWNVLHDIVKDLNVFTAERVPLLMNEICKVNADFVALQEVSSGFISHLLADDFIKQTYFVSSISMSEVSGPAEMGQLLLSKYSFKVDCVSHSLYKRSIVGSFGEDVSMAIVHLTAGLDRFDVDMIRKKQISDILSRKRVAFLIGDYNAHGMEAEMLIPDDYNDAWVLTNPKEKGDTFDYEKNSIAAITTQNNIIGRIDRILINKLASFAPISMELVGTVPTKAFRGLIFPSDHYGIVADLQKTPKRFSTEENIAAYLATQALFSRKDLFIQCLRSLSELFIQFEGSLRTTPQTQFAVLRMGADACAALCDLSDIDVLVFGELSQVAFFSQFHTFLKNAKIGPIDIVKNAKVPLICFYIQTIEVNLHYCTIPRARLQSLIEIRGLSSPAALSEHLPPVPNLIDSFNFGRVLNVLKKTSAEERSAVDCDLVDTIVEIANLMEINTAVAKIPSRHFFSPLIRLVKKWAHNRGISENKLGFVGGIGWCVCVIAFLAERICSSLTETLEGFFAHYSKYAFERNPISLADTTSSYVVKNYDFIAILTATKPVMNITRNSTRSSMLCLQNEFNYASSLLRTELLPYLFEVSFEINFFNMSNDAYLEVSVSAGSVKELRAWTSYIESRLVRLVIGLEKVTNSIVYVNPIAYECDNTEFCVRFFVKITNPPNNFNHTCVDFSAFERDLGDTTTWKGKTKSMSLFIRRLPGESINTKHLDKVNKSVFEEASTDDFEFEMIDDQQPNEVEKLHNNGPLKKLKEEKETVTVIGNPQKKGKKSESKPVVVSSKEKLRTSEDVFNRIRWDPSYDSNEFSVSYMDRFKGLMEVPFDDFDVENIPYHRIYIIKCRDEVVWDRTNRIDLVFNHK